jgi:hypothetical protein
MTLGTFTFSAAGVQVASSVAAHATGCDTWYGPAGNATNATSGLWGVPSNWSTGAIPATADDVCINVPGTYTVTLAPWSLGTADPNNSGDTVNSLVLGATSGAQTLDIAGQSSVSNSNEVVNSVGLNLVGSSTVNATGTLLLDSTSSGTVDPVSGGSAVLSGGTLLNYGHIVTQVEDAHPGAGTYISLVGLTNEPGSSLLDASGVLTEGEQNASSATNQGTVTVDAGASLIVTPNTFNTTTFTNDSSVVNHGSITVNNATWAQSAGSVTGNFVVLQSGARLADTSGAARFVQNYGTVSVTGTIPSNQTVTVLGEPFSSGGETYYSTTTSLAGAQLVNNGKLVLEATGTNSTTGGSVLLVDGSVVNNGSIVAQILNPSWAVHLQAAVFNHHGGKLSVTGGQLIQDATTATTNDGLVTVGVGASYVLTEGSSLGNNRDATTAVDIASAKSYGTIVLTGACCAGAGTFSAGGTLSPVLTHGYRPSVGKEFALIAFDGGKYSGTFATTRNTFRADYTHEGTTPAYVGAIYGAASRRPRLVSVSARYDRIVVEFSCPAAGANCLAASFKATVTEHVAKGRIISLQSTSRASSIRRVVIATGSARLKAGTIKTVSVLISRTGRSFFSKFSSYPAVVSVSSQGKTIRNVVVILHRPLT